MHPHCCTGCVGTPGSVKLLDLQHEEADVNGGCYKIVEVSLSHPGNDNMLFLILK